MDDTRDGPEWADASFEAHAADAAEIDRVWLEYWRPLLTDAEGRFNVALLKAELYDAWHLVNEARVVYRHVTGGLCDDLTASAAGIIASADRRIERIVRADRELADARRAAAAPGGGGGRIVSRGGTMRQGEAVGAREPVRGVRSGDESERVASKRVEAGERSGARAGGERIGRADGGRFRGSHAGSPAGEAGAEGEAGYVVEVYRGAEVIRRIEVPPGVGAVDVSVAEADAGADLHFRLRPAGLRDPEDPPLYPTTEERIAQREADMEGLLRGDLGLVEWRESGPTALPAPVARRIEALQAEGKTLSAAFRQAISEANRALADAWAQWEVQRLGGSHTGSPSPDDAAAEEVPPLELLELSEADRESIRLRADAADAMLRESCATTHRADPVSEHEARRAHWIELRIQHLRSRLGYGETRARLAAEQEWDVWGGTVPPSALTLTAAADAALNEAWREPRWMGDPPWDVIRTWARMTSRPDPEERGTAPGRWQWCGPIAAWIQRPPPEPFDNASTADSESPESRENTEPDTGQAPYSPGG